MAAAHVPGFGACVVLDDVVAVAEVVTVAPVPLVVDEELLLVVLLEVVVDVVVTSGPSHSFDILSSAQFQNCSGTPFPFPS